MNLENRLENLQDSSRSGIEEMKEVKVKTTMSEKSDAIIIQMNDSDGSCNSDDESESFFNSEWVYMPENVLIKIMMYLEVREVLDMGACCKRWFRISRDDWIWRKVFQKDFGLPINKKVGLKPGAETWYSEYKRLIYNVPMVLTDVLNGHSHQVLHVSFSHSGKLFCTCSKDGFVIVWNSSYPSTKKYSYDMKTLCWKYTQFSQFNSTDTLLLVSGVHFGVQNSTSGEIAVFSLDDDLRLKCRIVNRPYDIFGTWYTDQYLLSGDLHWLQHLISSSVIWINKASQEITSENVPIMNKLFRFYNRNASSVRSIMVAECPWLRSEQAKAEYLKNEQRPSREKKNPYDLSYLESAAEMLSDEYCAGNPISQAVLEQVPGPTVPSDDSDLLGGAEQYWVDFPYASTFQYSDEFRKKYNSNSSSTLKSSKSNQSKLTSEENITSADLPTTSSDPSFSNLSKTSDNAEVPSTDMNKVPEQIPASTPDRPSSASTTKSDNDTDVDDLENAPPKYLIFSTGSSVIWINKASQEITSENVPIMNKLFRFYNRNASSVRSIMVAECPWLRSEQAKVEYLKNEQRPSREKKNPYDLSYLESAAEMLSDEYCAGNPISQAVLEQVPGPTVPSDDSDLLGGAEQYWGDFPYASTFQYSDEFRKKYNSNSSSTLKSSKSNQSKLTSEENITSADLPTTSAEPSFSNLSKTFDNAEVPSTDMNKVPEQIPALSPDRPSSASTTKSDNDTDVDDLENAPPKYLIFSTGSKAYVPHQIAFKLVEKVSFPKQLDPGPSLKERIALRNQRRESENEYEEPDWANFDAVSDRFDKIDKIIDLHGQIIGMALSPDHRYLYVNCRPWPQNYVIRNPLEPPPIAQEIDIHMFGEDYVASGAEDMHAYVWERYYGVWLAKYNHSDVVNSVAFNPRDNEMLVTTSDDYEIKIWRSLAKAKEMNITPQGRATRFRPRTR
uniref:CSON007172 protein n=1 Tax=Culicoides sonorensis TaxID=179676 RepID=A0A336MXY2_CULSO